MQKLGIENPDKAFELWSRNFQKHRSEIALFEWIDELVNTLKERQFRLGLITSRTRSELNNDDALCEIFHLVDVSIYVTDTVKPKPSVEPILAYFEKTGATPSTCLYIGDAAYDSACAANSHIDFALATWSNGKKEIPCKYELVHPSDVLNIVG